MGDETGLRPKAGRQREEPPDADWAGLVTGRTGHKRREKALGGFRGPHSPRQWTDGGWPAYYPPVGHSVLSRTVEVHRAATVLCLGVL